jgi:hypothetical protein
MRQSHGQGTWVFEEVFLTPFYPMEEIIRCLDHERYQRHITHDDIDVPPCKISAKFSKSYRYLLTTSSEPFRQARDPSDPPPMPLRGGVDDYPDVSMAAACLLGRLTSEEILGAPSLTLGSEERWVNQCRHGCCVAGGTRGLYISVSFFAWNF